MAIIVSSIGMLSVYSEDLIASPLKQIKDGLMPEEVVCSDNLNLAIKKTNSNPACVKPDTLQKLVERGWAIDPNPTDKVGILVDTFTITLGDSGNTFELYSGDRNHVNNCNISQLNVLDQILYHR